MTETDETMDLLVVGAGPTGIAIGADAVRAGLSTVLVDRGPLAASIQAYPVYMKFFTTRNKLEIADVPFAIPEDKPDRRQALAYYRSVVEHHGIPTALYEEVEAVEREGDHFRVETLWRGPDLSRGGSSPSPPGSAESRTGSTGVGATESQAPTQPPAGTKTDLEASRGESPPGTEAEPGSFDSEAGDHRSATLASSPGSPPRCRIRRARAVALATGYFGNPRRLGVPGEELPWVSYRYLEPYLHHGHHVVVVGGGNSASEAALDLWRNGARVTLIHRRDEIKQSVKYWVKPDVENRIAEGSIEARFETEVKAFRPEGVEVEHAGRREVIPADAAYVLIGYRPDVGMLEACGVEVDPESLLPHHDPETLESNIPGLYVAGTALAGKHTDKIFIENTRDHGEKIVAHLLQAAKEPVRA